MSRTQTTDLWCQKWPLYQLYLTHILPNGNSMARNSNYRPLMSEVTALPTVPNAATAKWKQNVKDSNHLSLSSEVTALPTVPNSTAKWKQYVRDSNQLILMSKVTTLPTVTTTATAQLKQSVRDSNQVYIVSEVTGLLASSSICTYGVNSLLTGAVDCFNDRNCYRSVVERRLTFKIRGFVSRWS